MVAELGLGPSAEVLDLGAGTGKLTRELVPRFARVIAVEPDDAMRAVLEEVVPGAEALAGRGEAIPLARRRASTRSSRPRRSTGSPTDESVAEIARVLRPRGALVILWNIPVEFAHLGDEAEAVIDEAFERGGVPGLPRVLSGEWRRPIEDGPFEELREAEVERDVAQHARRVDRQPALGQLDRASARGGPGRVRKPPARARARRPRGAPPDPHGRSLDAPCLSWPSASGGSPPSTTTCGRSTHPRRSIAPRRCSASAPTRASSTWPRAPGS